METITNTSASELESLKHISEQHGKSFNSILAFYLQERLLYRLSISNYRNKFVLRDVGTGPLSLTPGMEFLAKYISNDVQSIKKTFEKICALPVDEDSVIFDVNGIHTERIKIDTGKEKIYVTIPASLENAERLVQLAIGFGDVMVPKSQYLPYPCLLSNTIEGILTYSKESMVSEKLENVISSTNLKDRMEDFYHIYTLAATRNFDGRVLWEAMFETFQKRGTSIERELSIFSPAFAKDQARDKQWKAFLSEVGCKESLGFHSVMKAIRNFLLPVYQAVIKEEEYFNKWNHEHQKWE